MLCHNDVIVTSLIEVGVRVHLARFLPRSSNGRWSL